MGSVDGFRLLFPFVVSLCGFRLAPVVLNKSVMIADEDNTLDVDLPDEAATQALGRRLAGAANGGDVFALSGDLGTGKSVLARAFIRAYCATLEDVPSPTFTLLEVYEGGAAPVHHFDLYRLKTPDEVVELGIEDAFADGVSLVEWPDRLGPWLPANRLDVHLRPGAGTGARRARLTGHGYWQARLIDGMGEGAIHA